MSAISRKLIDQVKAHEGFREKPYYCTSGKLTIGYGWNLDSGIDKELASKVLQGQLNEIHRSLCRIDWFCAIENQERRDVIVNMSFNLGVAGVCRFYKMINAISLMDYDQAADEMLDSKWAKQVGNRAVELAEQMRSGKYK